MKTISLNDMASFDVSKFAISEVLIDTTLKTERELQLKRAVLLHFLEHQTTKITFKDEHEEIFEIDCSIIAVTDRHVILKSGYILPILAIISLE